MLPLACARKKTIYEKWGKVETGALTISASRAIEYRYYRMGHPNQRIPGIFWSQLVKLKTVEWKILGKLASADAGYAGVRSGYGLDRKEEESKAQYGSVISLSMAKRSVMTSTSSKMAPKNSKVLYFQPVILPVTAKPPGSSVSHFVSEKAAWIGPVDMWTDPAECTRQNVWTVSVLKRNQCQLTQKRKRKPETEMMRKVIPLS